jgi:hypothetical protein
VLTLTLGCRVGSRPHRGRLDSSPTHLTVVCVAPRRRRPPDGFVRRGIDDDAAVCVVVSELFARDYASEVFRRPAAIGNECGKAAPREVIRARCLGARYRRRGLAPTIPFGASSSLRGQFTNPTLKRKMPRALSVGSRRSDNHGYSARSGPARTRQRTELASALCTVVGQAETAKIHRRYFAAPRAVAGAPTSYLRRCEHRHR